MKPNGNTPFLALHSDDLTPQPTVDPEAPRPAEKAATSIERRSPTRRVSRGNRHRLSPSVIVNLVQASDFLLSMFCGLLAKGALKPLRGLGMDGSLFLITLAGALAFTLCLSRIKGYSLSSFRSLGKQLQLVPVALVAGGCSMMVCLFLTGDNGLVFREWPFVWLLLSAILVVTSRCCLWRWLQGWIASGRLARRVAVIGAGEFSREFIERLRLEPELYTIVGLYDDRATRIPAIQAGVRVRGSVSDLLLRSREEQIDLIVIAIPLKASARIATILEQIGSAVADICLTTDFVGFRYRSSQISSVGSNPVVLLKEQPLKDWRAAEKLAFDIVLSSLVLLVLSPFLGLVALAIRLDSPGPVLFRQPRLGFNNRIFACYKFRTMHHDMTDVAGDQQATRQDARFTRLGKWLRTLSLDELPQLLNVLKGNMSLVGPRPHTPNTKAADQLFTDVVSKYALRHRMKPGITGWAQINGLRGETKTIAQIENRIAFDLTYIENWSIWFDLRIMMLTVTRENLGSRAF